jgi:Putative Ig domain
MTRTVTLALSLWVIVCGAQQSAGGSHSQLAGVCSISTTSLPGGAVTVSYSQTVATSGCASPSFSISSGLPPGLSINSSTGVILGTPTGGGSYSFTVQVTDAHGNATQALSIAITPAPSFTSGPTFSANSPSSILVSASTNVPVSVQMSCGSVTGPTVYGWSGRGWWGQTTFTYALTGLANNPSGTAYSCTLTVANSFGVIATAGGSAFTTAPLPSTPLTVASVGPPTRFNDQYNGSNGLPATGLSNEGDTRYTTWGADGNIYMMSQDSTGINSACPAQMLSFEKYSNLLSGSQLACFGAGPFNDPWSEEGLISVRGVQYLMTMNGYANQSCCVNMLKSSDYWTTSINAQDNVGPATASFPGVHQPATPTAAISGHSFSSGTLTLAVSNWTAAPPPPGSPVQISGSTNCDGFHWTTAASATSISYSASTDAVCTAGTVMYLGSMSPTITTTGDSGIYWLLGPIQMCQDYSVGCTPYAGNDGWVYFFAHYRGLFRIRIEDLPLQDITKFQCYAGTQNDDDGLYDSNWVNPSVGNCKALTAASGQLDPYLYMLNSANKAQITFVPDANRFLLTAYIGGNADAAASAIFDLGPYPWGKPVLIGSINRDNRYPGMSPGFGAAVLPTYKMISSSPYLAQMTWTTSGGLFVGSGPQTDQYSMFIWPVTLAAAPATQPAQPCMSAAGGPQCIPTQNLDVFYPGKGISGSLTIPNWSPNDPTQAYAYVNNSNSPVFYDPTGLVLAYPAGNGLNSTDGETWTAGPGRTLVSYTMPYAKQLGNFGAVVCWYRPYQLADTVFNPGAPNETIVSDPNFSIVRNGTAYGSGATWNIYIHGSLVGAVAGADGTQVCVALTNSGTTANIYQPSSVGRTPLARTATATVSARSSAGNLVLNSGANPYYGNLSALLVWSATPNEQQLISAMGGVLAWLSQAPANGTAQDNRDRLASTIDDVTVHTTNTQALLAYTAHDSISARRKSASPNP